jgi:2-polyprenyl-3-methyl-5-hydroxy-6-metoxy-1,4-benzoquinol methylase
MRGFRVAKEKHILHELSLCANKRVLHVGCTNSPTTVDRWEMGKLLHDKLCRVAKELNATVIGIDIDDSAIAFLRQKMPGEIIEHVDAHKLSDYFTGEDRFDLIIAGDVIEHLPNPGMFLESCARVLAPTGKITISTVNSFGATRFVKALVFHEAVHSEHTAYYSHKTMKRLLEMSGLEGREFGYYRYPERVSKLTLNHIVSTFIDTASGAIWPNLSEGVIVNAYLMKH